LLHQWDELIPSDTVDTSVSFQYDGPNSQAPQCLLLAVPPQRRKFPEVWHVDDLVEIVKDTMDLAKVRLVDLDAMREIEGDTSDEQGVGLVIPSLMFPADPDNPGWAREAFVETIKDWIELLSGPEKCATFNDYGFDTFGPQHEIRGFIIRSLEGNALTVGRLAFPNPAGGYVFVMCLWCAGDIEVELPNAANAIIFRAGWTPSTQAICLFDSAQEPIDVSVDTTTTQSAGMQRTPGHAPIGVCVLDVTIAAPGVKTIRITGESGIKFIQRVCILDP
jgi:hypothetical protein